MKTGDFNFDLPPQLIAQYPPVQHGDSRLMLLNRKTGMREHRRVKELPGILQSPPFLSAAGKLPLLVFNNSKVRKARLVGRALQSGARAEFLLLEERGGGTWKALVQRVKRRKPGSIYVFYDPEGNEINRAELRGAEKETCFLKFDFSPDDNWLDRYGHVPLPPYIRRSDIPIDAQRYQTIYASVPGSAAAPTAGLHFTRELLDELARAGIDSAFITLHVGMGTFWPVHSENIEEHTMHEEVYDISHDAAQKIECARAEGRKIIAIGTTSLRTLESAFQDKLTGGKGKTSIFIYPGYQFKIVNTLFTNFHTPESTLLMLVSAFACAHDTPDKNRGRELILESYREAIGEGYRFFSYGDAMLLF